MQMLLKQKPDFVEVHCHLELRTLELHGKGTQNKRVNVIEVVCAAKPRTSNFIELVLKQMIDSVEVLHQLNLKTLILLVVLFLRHPLEKQTRRKEVQKNLSTSAPEISLFPRLVELFF